MLIAALSKKGRPCFNPNTLISHASVAMKLYYQEMGKNFWNCNFTNSALIVIQYLSMCTILKWKN